MSSSQVILIVAAPGNLQAGLQLLMAGLSGVETLVAADEKSALGAIKRHKPSLVIVDGDGLGNKTPDLVVHIKRLWPQIRCLALGNNTDQCDETLKSGADKALVTGFPAARFIAVVAELLAA